MNRIEDQPILCKTCMGVSLGAYRIVYPKDSLQGDYYTALDLRYHLLRDGGLDVPCVDDGEAEAAYEILVGKTNRSDADCAEGRYRIEVRGGKILICAAELYGFVTAARVMVHEILKSGENALDAEGVIAEGEADYKIPARDTEYRMMMQNVWGMQGGWIHLSNRPRYTSIFFHAWMPDLLYLNEYWNEIRNHGEVQKNLLADGYAEAKVENFTWKEGRGNALPIFYRTDRFRQVECNITDLGVGDSSKMVTSLVLEDIRTGKLIGCLCSHLVAAWNCSYTVANVRKVMNVKVIDTVMNDVMARYPGITMLFAADCNANINSDTFHTMTAKGWVDARDLAREADDECSCHGYPVYDEELKYYVEPYMAYAPYRVGIDHIMVKGDGMTVRRYDTLAQDFPAIYSDHSPVFVDFDLK